jgi:hypothetical protein
VHKKALRQNLLVLYLANSSPDSRSVSWAWYCGTGSAPDLPGEASEPPYPSVVAAMKDGWRIISFPPIVQPWPGSEYQTALLRHEFVLEKMEEMDVA